MNGSLIQDGVRKKALQFLDKHRWPQRAQQASGVPGLAVAVVFAGPTAPEIRCYGVRDIDRPDRPVDAETIFALASVSKPMASTVIAALVGDGVLGWDDPIKKHVPEFELSDTQATSSVTVAEMLAHRSGLPDHAGDLLEDMGFDRQQILARLRHLPVGPRPAPERYTNFGFTLAAVAAARALHAKTGQVIEWEELCEQRLYQRLGMTHTSSRHARFAQDARRATGHQRFARNPGQSLWRPAAEPRNADAQSPAGGVQSSIADVAAWLKLVLNQGHLDKHPVVANDALRHAHTAYPPNSDSRYGLGWNVRPNGDLAHSGAFATGAATCVALLPELGVGIAILTNAEPIGLVEALAKLFTDHLRAKDGLPAEVLHAYLQMGTDLMQANMAAATDKGYGRWHANPSRPLEQYAGRYQHPYFGDIDVRVTPAAHDTHHGRQLTMVFGTNPQATPIPLMAWKSDAFVYQTSGENAVGLSAVEFVPPTPASPAGLRVTNLHYSDKTADYSEGDPQCPETPCFHRTSG